MFKEGLLIKESFIWMKILSIHTAVWKAEKAITNVVLFISSFKYRLGMEELGYFLCVYY